MRKILKILFSRFAIVTILILAQFALILYLLFGFRPNMLYYFVACYAIAAVFSIIIMIKDEIPEYKLPWLLTILLVPGFGFALYCLFGRTKVRRRDRKRFKQINNLNQQYIKSNIELKDIENDNARQIFYYLNDYIKLGVYKNTSIKYFPMGEDFLPCYIEDLKKAKKYIFIEYYILCHGKGFDQILDVLVEKMSQGVEVRMMYDDFGSILYVKTNFARKMREKGINCKAFNRYIPLLSVMMNNRDHRKITVIDGKVGYTGGLNLSDEYFNFYAKFGTWKDNAVRLEGEAVNNLTGAFLTMFNSKQEDIQKDYSKYIINYDNNHDEFEKREGICCPFIEAPNPIYIDKIAKNVYLHLINTAKHTIDISTPYFVTDSELTNAILNACKRGVKVNVLIPGIPDKKTVYILTVNTCRKIAKAGGNIYKYTPGFNHTKTVLIDNQMAVVGTINLDYRSLAHNYENAVLMYKNECIKDIQNDFESTFKISYKMTKEDLHIGKVKQFFISVYAIFSPLF